MLHLAIIGIVCAIYAPYEDASFIGQKNNESVFCRIEKEQNVAKVSLSSYYVGVYNSSGCAKQKITNRTSSFFYDYIINQYQDSKNCSRSVMKNAFLKKEKKPHPNIEFAFKKRSLLWTQHNSKFDTKTLRPVMKEVKKFPFQWLIDQENESKKSKVETNTKSGKKFNIMDDKYNLNPEQKRMLMCLKDINHKPKANKLFQQYLDKIKVVDEVDLNKRIEKLVKEVALENRRKDKYYMSDYNFLKNYMSDFSEEEKVKESLFNSIKKFFCFYKNFFQKKKRYVNDIMNSFTVNKVRGKGSTAEKMALRSNSYISKTKGKNRFKRNRYSSYNDFSDPTPHRRQFFVDVPYPYSANFKNKRCFLPPPYVGQVFPEIEKMRSRPRNNLENWPFFKKEYFDKQKIPDWRMKLLSTNTEASTSPPATEEKDSTTVSNLKETEKSTEKTTELTHTETSSEKKIDKTTKETTITSITSSESPRESTTANLNIVRVTQKGDPSDPRGVTQDSRLDYTLEKPFLKNEKFKYHKSAPNFKNNEFNYYNSMTDFPILDSSYFQPNIKYTKKMPKFKRLMPFRFLQIRHALRNFIARKNAWSPYNRYYSFERRKRCGKKRRSMPRKCWRSAPLLCVPYIKKNQEDILKYLIKIMQKMIGKPLPLKRNIFENTKFRPFAQKEVFNGWDNTPDEDINECESEAAPVSNPEYFRFCSNPTQPLYCPNSKPCSVNSPNPTCLVNSPNPSYPVSSQNPSCPINSPSSSYPSYDVTPQFYAASLLPPYFPISNPDRVNSDFMKSFSYTNFSPLQLRPRINSWPPDISFHLPHIAQTANLDPGNNVEKYATNLPKSTASAPVSTTIATTVTSGTNATNPSQNIVSHPVNSSTTISRAATTFPSSSSSTDFKSQSASTTAAPLISTDFGSLCSTPSATSAFPLVVSNLPIEEENFSYTVVSLNGESESATVNNLNLETVSLMPLDDKLFFYNTTDYHCDTCFPMAENTSPIDQQLLEWPSATDPLPTIETFPYPSQTIDPPTLYKEPYKSFPENFENYNQYKKDGRNQIIDLSKSNEDLLNSFQNNVQNLEDHQKLFNRMKHKKKSKSRVKPKPTDFLPYYDYYLYDKYPLINSDENNNPKFGFPQLPFWKDFGRKIKNANNFKSLIRRKRKDYDFKSDDFDSYNEYLDDSNDSYEDLNEFPEPYAKGFNKNYLESGGTSPSYEMLSELAKILTESNATTSEPTTPTSNAITPNSTDQSTKPKQDGEPALQMDKSTSNKTVDTAKDNKKLIQQSNSKSSNLHFKVPVNNTTLSSESHNMSYTTTPSDKKTINKDRAMDLKKSGESSFFQTHSKVTQNSKNSKNSKKDSGKEEKEPENNKVTKTTAEGQIPTTLKTATVVKGQKKSFTKPSSKVYPKVYPESCIHVPETNDTTTASTVTTVKANTENRTALLSSTSKPDIRLQLLAVCEGYLEIVKLIKNQNQTNEGVLDADLSRYCENIISQSFNNQIEKPKKSKLIEFPPQNTDKEDETGESFSENASRLNSQNNYETARDFSESQLRKKIIATILKNPVPTKKTPAEKSEINKVTSNDNNNDNDNVYDENYIDEYESENEEDDDNNYNDNNITEKNDEEGNLSELEANEPTEAMEADTTTEKDDDSIIEYIVKKKRKGKTERGLSNEEMKILQILKKRKKELLSWLKDQNKLDNLDETEFIEDEGLITETKTTKNSGTIKPKSEEKGSGREKQNFLFYEDSDFPVYAKQYGYDKGGELRDVEILWRKVNKKTREEHILKNLSIPALYITSWNVNNADPKFLVNDGNRNECLPEIKITNQCKPNCSAVNSSTSDVKPIEPVTVKICTASLNISCGTLLNNMSTKSTGSDIIHTCMSKPNLTLNVEELQKGNNVCPQRENNCCSQKENNCCPQKENNCCSQNENNCCSQTYNVCSYRNLKSSRKFQLAKALFQEYTIEFVNYAVYILPIMLTIIFLFCCMCCGLHILKAQQSLKRYRRQMKKQCAAQETSDTTDECVPCSKKKKRKVKFKKRPQKPDCDVGLDKMKIRKFWSILKINPNSCNLLKKDCDEKGQKKTLLRFLKGEKYDNTAGKFLSPLFGCSRMLKLTLDKKKNPLISDCATTSPKEKEDDDSCGSDEWSDTTERRELIALLEEVKKIEIQQMDCKKELKSVEVQCKHENDTPTLQCPDVFYAFQNMPKGYSSSGKPYPCQQKNPTTVGDDVLCEDVNELTELLPCECTHLQKKPDCLTHYDFNVNQQNPCKNFLKMFRDSGMYHNTSFNEKKCVKNESENRNFIFNKYKSIRMNPREELMGVTQENADTEMRLTNIAPPFALPSQKNSEILKEIDNLKRQLNNKKDTHLKDDGVLCRL